jgi:hypothetical protein
MFVVATKHVTSSDHLRRRYRAKEFVGGFIGRSRGRDESKDGLLWALVFNN